MLRADDARAVIRVSARNVGNAVRPKAGVVVQGMAEVHNGATGRVPASQRLRTLCVGRSRRGYRSPPNRCGGVLSGPVRVGGVCGGCRRRSRYQKGRYSGIWVKMDAETVDGRVV